MEITVFSQKFRQINVLLKNFTMNWFNEKIAWHANEFVLCFPFQSIVDFFREIDVAKN